MQLTKECIKLTQKALKRYLNHDLWTIVEVAYLLTGYKPSGYNELIFRNDVWAQQYDVYLMAKSSLTAGKINGHGKCEATFQATPQTWIAWALSKELAIPKSFVEAYQVQQKTAIEHSARSQESYRPRDEWTDKMIVQQLGKVLHTLFPECPISQLVRISPIKEWIDGHYTNETICQWLKDAGIQAQNGGRPTKKAKLACLARMPEQWRSFWE